MDMQNIRPVQSDDDLASLLADPKPSAVMFYADWCPDCRRFKPSFGILAKDYGRHIAFLAVDVASLPQLEEKYAIGLIPTVLLFEGGKLARTWEFVEPVEPYRQHFDEIAARRS